MKLRLLAAFFVAVCCASRTFAVLTAADVQTVIAQAIARAAQISPNSVIAVTDREGDVLGVWVMRGGEPTTEEVATAVSKAGTAAYLSSNQEAFTSRTAGFIIQQHFPPGVRNTSPGPLVGVGLSNLFFSDINKFRAPGSIITFSPTPGLAIVPVFGSSLDGSPGGVPLYQNGVLVGAVGVTGDGVPGPLITDPASPTTLRSENPFIFIPGYDKDEDVALAGQHGYDAPRAFTADHVYINGIALPYVESSTSFAGQRLIGNASAKYAIRDTPPPFPYPPATFGGYPGEIRQPIIDDPIPGAINGQRRLTAEEVSQIIDFAADRARTTRAGIRLPIGVPMEVFITVVNNPNQPGANPTVLGAFRTGEATLFSWDVAVQKGRTALGFSSNTLAISTRTVGFLAQTRYPPGLDVQDPGPYFGLQEGFSGFQRSALPNFILNPTFAPDPRFPNGITIFPGGFPLYRNGQLIGAVGISGDGVDQDDIVGASGTHDFLAPNSIRADQFGYLGARLPYAKFPRDPNGVGDVFQPTPTAAAEKLSNISTRVTAGSAEQQVIGGFILSGDAPKKVIVRALGPSLSQAGVAGTLSDPVLELHDASGAIVAANDNWRDSQEAEIEGTGLAPNDNTESAIVRMLDPGSYTAVAHNSGGETGVGLVEVYDLSPSGSSSLANISTRGTVGADENVMIGGFIVAGTSGDTRVLVRAVAPSLAAQGVTGALADPMLELRDVNGTVVAMNDNWRDGDENEIAATGLAPADDAEAAVLTTLPSGDYTVIVRATDSRPGVGLFEVYNLQN
ncbi:MAG: heme-binding protein [Chthoniobacterales bacterium]